MSGSATLVPLVLLHPLKLQQPAVSDAKMRVNTKDFFMLI
jgi:hypothetical protein